MVVDDEPDIAATMKMALEKSGFAVDAFTDPQKAIDSFVKGKYAMVITDIKMPQINGFELYRHIQKIDDKTKVAFMTAFEIHENELGKLLPNIDVKCFFKKPILMQDLIDRVKETSEEITMS